jgi:hypothetical protein
MEKAKLDRANTLFEEIDVIERLLENAKLNKNTRILFFFRNTKMFDFQIENEDCKKNLTLELICFYESHLAALKTEFNSL